MFEVVCPMAFINYRKPRSIIYSSSIYAIIIVVKSHIERSVWELAVARIKRYFPHGY